MPCLPLTRSLFRARSIEVKALFCCGPADSEGSVHEHDASRISLVRGGVFARVIRGASILADATQVLFVNRGDIERFVHPLEGGHSGTVLEPSPATLREVQWHFDRFARRFPVEQTNVSRRILLAHYHLLDILERRGAGNALGIEEVALDLCTDLVGLAHHASSLGRVAGLTGAEVKRRELVERVRVVLNARLHDTPGLTELAQTMQCSTFHLTRVFKAYAGMPIRSYVAVLRAVEAARRITEGTSDLGSLALELGYYDHSHLTKAFKAVWGIPPASFRERGGPAHPIRSKARAT